MDTTSSGFGTAFSVFRSRKRAKDNQIRLIYRLFPKEPSTFNYGKKRFFTAFFAVFLLLFVIVVPNAKAAFVQDYLAGFLSSIISGVTGNDSNQNSSASSPAENMPIVQDSALISYSGPSLENSGQADLFTVYTVKPGDTLVKIASDYGISLNTLLWANNLTGSSIIQPGQELKILPVDGVLYTVKKGDNLSAIAKKYKSEIEAIIEFNDLPATGEIRAGDVLLLPGAEMAQVIVKAAPKPGNKAAGSAVKQSLKELWEEVNRFFIVPVSGIITQLKHGQNGVDVGNSCGTPVFAAADGVVTVVQEVSPQAKNARSRLLFGGYGNNVRISHSNGTLTLYSHLFSGSILVQPGQEVRQGQQMAQVGGGWDRRNVRMIGAGRSTGCHLHFETRGTWGTKNVLSQYRRGALVTTPAAVVAIDSSATGAGDDLSSSDSSENNIP